MAYTPQDPSITHVLLDPTWLDPNSAPPDPSFNFADSNYPRHVLYKREHLSRFQNPAGGLAVLGIVDRVTSNMGSKKEENLVVLKWNWVEKCVRAGRVIGGEGAWAGCLIETE